MPTLSLAPTVAIVDETGKIDPAELARYAGAQGEQVSNEFANAWPHAARAKVIAAAPGPRQWAVRIRQRLDEPGALGYHTDDNGVPVSYVMLTKDWTVTASHETLEMLCDPSGSYTHSARVPQGINYRDVGLKHASTYVHYLVEVCDPCERTSYEVQGVELSDFLLPTYYRTTLKAGAAYSYAGGVGAPRQVASGGYVSFAREDHEWFQVMSRGGTLQLEDIGRFDRQEFATLREFTDAKARELRER